MSFVNDCLIQKIDHSKSVQLWSFCSLQQSTIDKAVFAGCTVPFLPF